MSINKKFVKSRNVYKVDFELPESYVPNAKEVRLLGEFNNWDWKSAPVMKNSKGVYKLKFELEPGKKYEYRFLADETVWVNDGIADEYVPSPHFVDNCVVDLTK